VVPPIAPLSAPIDNSYIRAATGGTSGQTQNSLLQTDDRTSGFFQPVGESAPTEKGLTVLADKTLQSRNSSNTEHLWDPVCVLHRKHSDTQRRC
jgi:hypothetical protein